MIIRLIALTLVSSSCRLPGTRSEGTRARRLARGKRLPTHPCGHRAEGLDCSSPGRRPSGAVYLIIWCGGSHGKSATLAHIELFPPSSCKDVKAESDACLSLERSGTTLQGHDARRDRRQMGYQQKKSSSSSLPTTNLCSDLQTRPFDSRSCSGQQRLALPTSTMLISFYVKPRKHCTLTCSVVFLFFGPL